GDVQRLWCRYRTDRRLGGGRLALQSLDDPLEHAGVLAVPRPEELPFVAAPEPVDVEDRGQFRRVAGRLAAALAHLDPMIEVVARVIADEGQHRHRVTADNADLANRGRGRLGRQRGAHIYAVDPVAGLGDQRDRGLAAATKQDRVDRDALRVFVFVGEDRALLDRRAESAVRVAR